MWEQGVLGSFQNKSASSTFNIVSRYILFLTRLKRRGRSFLTGARRMGAAFWDYLQEHLVVIRDENVCPFVKCEIIVPLLCCLLDPLTNKHCRAWSSMINLWIDSRTCQKYSILLSPRQRSNELLAAFKRKCFGDIDHDLLECSSWYGFTEADIMSSKYMYWKLKKTTYFHSFLGNFLIP